MFEMHEHEKKAQDFTFLNLNKFINKYKKYIHCSKKELMRDIPEELFKMIENRQYYIDDDVYQKLLMYPNFKNIVDKKRDNRTVTALIYYVITTTIYENVLIEILKNLNCQVERTGTSFQYDMSKAKNDADITVVDGDNVFKLELQRSNFVLRNNPLEVKYSKINKNILNYIIDNDGNLRFLIVNVGKSSIKKYDAAYTNYLNCSHKKGYYLNNIKLDNFLKLEDVLISSNNFDDFFKKSFC
ncbi:hypothetical protein B5E87_00210 [Massilimicrobiota sp. An142]|uniref:hypothetical protein n=1 Tax=Massilimicrobiota sp. An142 TaxID=1965564 RepID=UPI000B3996DF|nr:hypothetical protein [Massilimicrobiota sp. An142]OUQ15029.1 hypothetical protein B5E87_00210 [Massilimicrobiota sp. An142]